MPNNARLRLLVAGESMPVKPPAAAWPSVENWLAPIGVADEVRAFLNPVVVAIGAVVAVGTAPAGASQQVSWRAIRQHPMHHVTACTVAPLGRESRMATNHLNIDLIRRKCAFAEEILKSF
ncbi:hypothetical protein [Mesorhizobium huakuii]|uniref:Uncharacterized protein n=1 Tax=Mesorhizobium huakuii TaxID=28104 RepID=A0A7G6T1G3_9HYPH|nr:hypothetical protein [Mesorhizobium huakuii]QND60595.1 hypothetical protein HB778_31815 [Mesorhizobium huakuii]